MIVAFALAIGTLGAAPDVPQRVEADCVRHEPIAVHRKPAATHKPRKPVKHKPRLFKSDPKPIIEENCEEELPSAPSVPPLFEVEYEYSVPIEPTEPPVVPVLAVPGVETPECGCFGRDGGPVFFAFGPDGVWYVHEAPTPAVPEPGSWLLVGLGLLATHLKSKPKKSDFLAGRISDS